MSTPKIPLQLLYNQLQTKAFYSVFRPWPIQPTGNGGQYWPGQVMRIYLNGLMDGVMDPYRTHMQITVSCDVDSLPVGLLQIDNSAQSLIQQIIITSKNRQIERILQYGVLAAYLTDIGLSQLYAEGRQTEGLGFNNMDNIATAYNVPQSGATGNVMIVNTQGNSVNNAATRNPTAFPTIPTRHLGASSWGGDSFPISLASSVFKGHLNWLNPVWLGTGHEEVWYWYQYVDSNNNLPQSTDNVLVATNNVYGYSNNLRAQYLAQSVLNDYCDSTSSYAKHQMHLDLNQTSSFPQKYTNTTVYNTSIPQTLPFRMDITSSYGNNYFCNIQVPNSTSLLGFSNLMSPNFAKGVRQPIISPTIGQCQMQNGVILPEKIPVSSRTFRFPLISSTLGILIPESQFVLIPLQTLNDTFIQMTIDPYAMFTSGYNDVSQFDDVGMGLMQKRAFKVTRVVYNLHTYQFYNPQILQYLKVNINSGIAITTHYWEMANQYSVDSAQNLTNNWSVACNQQALVEVLAMFYPLDYQRYSFCRKHFRISNGIRSFQVRFNGRYFPSQPLTGNAGNPIQLDSSGDNFVYLQQIMNANGYRFSNIAPLPRINAYNFAINDRCYNPNNANTFYDPAMFGNAGYQWGSNSVNQDTALGMCHIHENRYVGKAAFLYSFQPSTHSKDSITGVDVRKASNFEIAFTATTDNYFPRSQMLFIYTKSVNIIEFGAEGIININK